MRTMEATVYLLQTGMLALLENLLSAGSMSTAQRNVVFVASSNEECRHEKSC